MIKDFLKKYKNLILLSLILILAFLVRIDQINEPWVGRHDGNGARFSLIARNYLRFGYLNTKFGQIINPELRVSENFIFDLANLPSQFFKPNNSPFIFYLTHPPLLSIILSFVFLIVGESEVSARILVIIFSLLSILVFYFLVKRVWNSRAALYSCFLMAFVPLSIYFGRMVCHEPLLLFFILLCIYFYILWLAKYQTKYFILMIITFILGALVDWPIYCLPFVLLIHYLITQSKERLKLMILFLLISFILFTSYFLYIIYLTDSFNSLEKILEVFYHLSSKRVDLFSLFYLLFFRSLEYFTPLVVFLFFFWFLNFIRAKEEDYKKHFLIFFFLIIGSIPIFIFKENAWIHEYWLYYFIPMFALTGGLTLLSFEKLFKKRFIILFLSFLALFSLFSFLATNKLYQFDDNSFFYLIGVFLKEKVSPGAKVITSLPFLNNLIINYYSEKEVYWQIRKKDDLLKIIKIRPKEKYYFLTLENESEIEEELKNYLLEKFNFQRFGPVLIFDLNI